MQTVSETDRERGVRGRQKVGEMGGGGGRGRDDRRETG